MFEHRATRSSRRFLVAGAVSALAVLLQSASPVWTQALPVTTLLDKYLAGEFDAVVAHAEALSTAEKILTALDESGDGWINRDGGEARDRRELAAATFALEIARTGVWSAWKFRQVQPLMFVPGADPATSPAGSYRPRDLLTWAPAAKLVEWGCARFRKRPQPTSAERWWQLGAMAVAERAEDPEFLIGAPDNPPANDQDEYVHLQHALARFPEEPRFHLVQALTFEWRTWPEIPRGVVADTSRFGRSLAAYESLLAHGAVGAEAQVRMAGLLVRTGQTARALEMLTAVEDMTRDRYLVYLARFFKGRALEREHRLAEAAEAYRGAVAAMPGAQAASLSLAAHLSAAGRLVEAHELTDRMLSTPAPDPWRGYADADDRFWPEIIARLRAEIQR